MVLAEMLVEDSLEGEALAADVAVEGLVPGVLADVVLQLVLARVLLSTHAAHEWRDAHVQPHVTIEAALLVKGFAAVDTGEAWIVAEPTVAHLLTQILLIPSHIKHSCFLSLQGRKPKMSSFLYTEKLVLVPHVFFFVHTLNCKETGATDALNSVEWHFNNESWLRRIKQEQRQEHFEKHREDEECISN